MYSGAVAAKTIAAITLPETVLLLGPNHTGRGEAFSIMTEGAWQTPFGQAEIDMRLAKKLLARSRLLREDASAHQDEHSLEVQVPLLQYFKSEVKIIPIAISADDLTQLQVLGNELATVVREAQAEDSVLLAASSDMTHYEPQKQAKAKDQQAIAAILDLNEEDLFKRIAKFDISMCGYAPVAVMLAAAKALGARKGELVSYQTSGDVSGDFSSVVGYAGIIIPHPDPRILLRGLNAGIEKG